MFPVLKLFDHHAYLVITVKHCYSEVLLCKGPIHVSPQPDVKVVFWRWGEPGQELFLASTMFPSYGVIYLPLQGHAVLKAWTRTEGMMREIDP